MKIKHTDHNDQEFIKLVSELDIELWRRYGDDQHEYDKLNGNLSYEKVFILEEDDKSIGCGGYKKIDEDTAEIKRVFIHPEYRGRGLSRLIIREIEKVAKEYGFIKCILETGPKQHEAIGLYEGLGYTKIDNYGQYKGMELSICYERLL